MSFVRRRSAIVGRVKIGKGSVVFGKSVVRGLSIIGENCKIGPSAYVGPYTAIGDRCMLTMAEVDDSIVMDDTLIDFERKLVRSMVGKGTKTLNANGLPLRVQDPRPAWRSP